MTLSISNLVLGATSVTEGQSFNLFSASSPLAWTGAASGVTLSSITVTGLPVGDTLSETGQTTKTSTGGAITLAGWNPANIMVNTKNDKNIGSLTITIKMSDGSTAIEILGSGTSPAVTVAPLADTIGATSTTASTTEGMAASFTVAAITSHSYATGDSNSALGKVTISGLPAGAVIRDDNGNTATAVAGVVDVTSLDLAHALSFTAPTDGQYTLTVSAWGKDADGDLSMTAATETVTVNVAPPAPVVHWLADPVGAVNAPIALSGLVAMAQGSSSDVGNRLQLVISGLPTTAVLSDGTHSSTIGATSVDVSSWTLANLTVTSSSDVPFTLTATATEYNGTLASASSSATDTVSFDVPTPVIAISGTAQVGNTLTASDTANTGDTLSYQWLSSADGTSWTPITGATSATYTVQAADYGNQLAVQVTASHSGDVATTATSAATDPVLDSAPTISVTGVSAASPLQEGQTVTADLANVGANETVTYQWFEVSQSGKTKTAHAIAGATGQSLVAPIGAAGLKLEVVATAFNQDLAAASSSYVTGIVAEATPTLGSTTLVTGADRKTYVNAAVAQAQTFGGSADPGATINLYLNGQTTPWATTTADPTTGKWSVTENLTQGSPSYLADGSYTLTATATAANGTVSPASAPLSFILDTASPTASATATTSTGTTFVKTGSTVIISLSSSEPLYVTAGSALQLNNDELARYSAATGKFCYSVEPHEDVTDLQVVGALGIITDAAGNPLGTVTGDTGIQIITQTPATPSLALADDTSNGSSDTSVDTLNVTGNLATGATVQFSLDGQTWTTATANGDGTYTAPGTTSDGTYTVQVRQIDQAGNISNASTPLAFTLDTQAPAAPELDLVDGTSLTQPVITNVGTVTAVATENNVEFQYSTDGGQNWNPDKTDGRETTAGQTYTVYTASADGAQNVEVRELDVANNAGTASTASFYLDTTGVGTLNVAVAGGAIVDNAAVTATGLLSITGLASDITYDGASYAPQVQYSFDGLFDDAQTATLTAQADGSYTFQPVFPAGHMDGIYTVTVQQMDAAGNVSGTTPVVFTLDTTPPAATATVTALSSYSSATPFTPTPFDTNQATQTVSGTLDQALADGQKVQLEVNNGQWVDATVDNTGTNWSVSDVTLDASGTLAVRTIDAVGNVNPGNGSTYVFNPTPPLVQTQITALSDDTGASSTDFLTRDQSQTVYGTEVGFITGDQIQLQVNDDGWMTATVDAANGAWSVTGVSLDGGTGTLAVRTLDIYGNVTDGASQTYVLKNTSPQAPSISLTNDTGLSPNDDYTSDPSLTVTGVPGDTLQYQVNGGAWTSDAPVITADGTYTVTADQTDIEGNVSDGATLIFTLDTHTPAAPTVALDFDSSNGADITTDGVIDVSGVEPDAEYQYQVYKNGTLASDWSTKYPTLATDGSADGQYSISVRQEDLAGIVSPASSVAFTLQDASPASPASLSLDESTTFNGATYTRTGNLVTPTTDVNGNPIPPTSAVLWSTDGIDFSTTKPDFSNALDGTYTVYIEQQDIAGATSSSTDAFVFTLERQPPAAVASISALSVDTGIPGDFKTSVAGQTLTGTYTGTLAADDTIQVSVDNGATWTPASSVDPTTNSWTAFVTLLPGANRQIEVQTVDGAGNVTSGGTQAYVFDDHKPDAPVITGDSAVVNGFVNLANDGATQAISGTAEKGATVALESDYGPVGTVTADASTGAWSVTTGSLSAGDHFFFATATDVEGKTSTMSQQLRFTVKLGTSESDITDTAVTPSGNVNYINGTSIGSGDVTTLSGTAEAGDSVAVVVGGETLTATADGSDGSWSVTTAGLADGATYTAVATATDAAGNTATSNPFSFTVKLETSESDITDTAVNAAGYIGAAKIGAGDVTTLSGTAEAGDSVSVLVGGQTLTTTADASTGAWSVTTDNLADGTYTAVATATDAAGNTATNADPFSFTVKLETSAVTVTDPSITKGPDGNYYLNKANIGPSQTTTLTGTAEAGATVELSYQTGLQKPVYTSTTAAADGSWSLTTNSLIDDAFVDNLRVTATDAAGNISYGYLPAHFYVKLEATESPISDSAVNSAGFINASTTTLSGTADFGAQVSVVVGGQTLTTTAAPWNGSSGGEWSVTATGLADGTYTAVATETDLAGNTASSGQFSFAVKLETTESDITDAAVTQGSDGANYINEAQIGDGTTTLTGTADANDSVSVVVGDQTLTTTASASDGTWSVTTGPLADNTAYTAVATATDAAGNTESSAAFAFTVKLETSESAITSKGMTQGTDGVTYLTYAKTYLNGTAEANDSVTVTDGAQTATTTADSNGAWSVEIWGLDDNTTYTAVATATDVAGNTASSAPLVFKVKEETSESNPSDAATVQGSDGVNYINAAHFGDGTTTLTGTAEPGDSVSVAVGGQILTTTANGPGGAWSVTTGQLTDKTGYIADATATDAAGNSWSDDFFQFVVKLETSESAITDTAVSTGSDNANYINTANYGNGTTTLTGTAEDGDRVSVVVGGQTLTTTASGSGGAWSVTTGSLSDSTTYTAVATATDLAGNTASSGAFVFTVKLEATESAISDQQVQAGYINGANATYGSDTYPDTILTGTAEAGDQVAVTVSGHSNAAPGTTLSFTADATAGAGGAWSLGVTDLNDNWTYTATATATDAAGNTATSDPFAFGVKLETSESPIQDPGLFHAEDGHYYISGAWGNFNGTTTLQGTAEAGDSVSVLVGGQTLTTTADASTGAWSVKVGSLTDGATYTAVATATDAAGNTASSTPLSFAVKLETSESDITDTAVNAAGYIGAASINPDGTTTLTGSAEPGDAVIVYVVESSGVQLGAYTVTTDANGAWSAKTDVLADNTTYTVTATALDAALNTKNSDPYIFTVKLETTPLRITSLPETGGYINATEINPDDTVTLGGTAEPGDTVTLVVGGQTVTTTADSSTGAWSLTTGALSDNTTYSSTVTATDKAGNTSSISGSATVKLETSESAITDTAVSGGYINAAHIGSHGKTTLSGTAEAGDSVSVLVGGETLTATAAAQGGAWSVTTGSLGDGAYTAIATATDAAGNTASSPAFTFAVKLATTESAITDTAVSGGYINAAHIGSGGGTTLSGTAEIGDSVSVVVGGQTLTATAAAQGGAWSVTTGSLSEGAYTAIATATDVAGNTASSAAFTFAVKLETSESAITDTAVSGGYISAARIGSNGGTTLSGTAEAGDSVSVVVGGQTLTATAAAQGGAWSVTTGSLSDGAYTAVATATDAAGNTATSAAFSFNVKATLPTAPAVTSESAVVNGYVNAANDVSGQTVSGTSQAGMAITLYDNGALAGTTTADSNGNWTVTLANKPGEGANTLTATATDVAGNTSAASSPLTFTVDTKAPAANATITALSNDTGSLATDFITNGQTQTVHGTFTGTLGAGEAIQVSANGSTWVTATTSGSTWSAANVILVAGINTLSVRAIDPAGNVTTGASKTYDFDNVNPVFTDGISSGGSLYEFTALRTGSPSPNGYTYTFRVDTSDAGSGVAKVAIIDVTANKTLGYATYTAGTGLWQLSYNPGANQSLGNDSIEAYVTDVAGNSAGITAPLNAATGSFNLKPAGVSGSVINLGLTAPAPSVSGPVSVTLTGVPSGWTVSGGVLNADGTWSVTTADVTTLGVTAPASFSGAVSVKVAEAWTNADGTAGYSEIDNNVESYAKGAPIFALAGDDNLTGSTAGKDEFVFNQPIGNDTLFKFNALSDKIDLVGYAGFTSFTNVKSALSTDASGDAVLTLGQGQTITFVGVNAATLKTTNFVFNAPVSTVNTGTMALGDGADMPLAGAVQNSGAIDLNAASATTTLTVLSGGLQLSGGGRVVLSDNAGNLITGTTPTAGLTNIDNTISGAGDIGGGQMTLANSGTIIANGANALVIDTGSNAVTNTGTLAAAGGTLIVASNLLGTGAAIISGGGLMEFAGSATAATNFADGAADELKLDKASSFTGVISGFGGSNKLDLASIAFGSQTTLGFTENAAGTGGVLTVGTAAASVSLNLLGQYAAAGFSLASDNAGGALVTYSASAAADAALATQTKHV